ncbi:MAG: hypothetical protein ABW133_00310 [Polyangiaceae bacterium]
MTKRTTTTAEAPAFPSDWLLAGADRARARVDEAKERGADLVAAWIAGKNAAAVAAVAADDAAPAPARKAARRGINVLKSRGIAIPEAPREKRATEAAAVTYEAWFRPPDAAGTSAFTLGARGAGGKYRLVDVILQDGKGIASAAGMEMSRSQLRETFDGIEQRFGHGPASVPIAWARVRIAAARAENAAHGTPLPLGLDQHDELLNGAPSAPPVHPAEEMKLALPGVDDALARSGTLHAEPELRGWLPLPSAMQDLLRQIDEEKESLKGADRATTEAKVVAIVERSTDSYFTAELRDKTSLRMKDAAISLIARGETSRAADLLVTAREVAEGDRAPHAIPFLRGFFEKAFGLAAARAARKPA